MSHLGYIIGGWISYEDRSIALIIVYLFSFVFLYISLQYIYQCISDIMEHIKSKNRGKWTYQKEIEERKEHYYKTGFDFSILFLMFIPWLLLNGIIICIGSIFVQLPLLESIDFVLTHIYTLGQYTFVFAVFLLTYKLLHVIGEGGASGGGIINKEVLNVWKYLYKQTPLRGTVDTAPQGRIQGGGGGGGLWGCNPPKALGNQRRISSARAGARRARTVRARKGNYVRFALCA